MIWGDLTFREKWFAAVAVCGAAAALSMLGFVIARSEISADWVSASVAAFGLVAAIAAYLSSEETGRREHRAYVEVEPVGGVVANLKFVELKFRVRNYGRTPCRFTLAAEMRVLIGGLTDEYPYHGSRDVENLHPGEAKEVVIFCTQPLSDDEFNHIQERETRIGIQGNFNYVDVFRTIHTEAFSDKVAVIRTENLASRIG